MRYVNTARKRDVNRALAEGVHIDFLTRPVRILSDAGGCVSGIEYRHAEKDAKATDSRQNTLKMKKPPASLKADLIIAAYERVPDLRYLGKCEKLEMNFSITPKGTLGAEKFSQLASAPNIFTAGDMHTGRATVAGAVAGGRLAARSIHYLLTTGSIPLPDNLQWRIKPESILKDVRLPERIPKITIPERPVAVRCRSFVEEVVATISTQQAAKEAARCLQCGTFCYDGRTTCMHNSADLDNPGDQHGKAKRP